MKNVIVIILLSFLMDGVFGADEMKEVTDGDSLTLPTGLTQTQSSDQIFWLYGSDKIIIAKIDKGIYSTNVDDERFKGNLELDKQTGSLTIKNIRIKNTGLYELDINRGTTSRKFSVKVYASLPTPDIDSTQCVKTPVGPICVFLCSVQSSDQTTLSWYSGNSVVSSKISDICSSISLRLEVNYEDKNIYSCMVNNPISNKTKHLDITQLCKPCEVPYSGPSSGVITGIVFTVLVSAAAVVIYIRYRRSEPEKQIDSIDPETVGCKEGGSAVLPSYQEVKKGVQMLWRRVSVKVSAIASMSESDKKTYWYDTRFGGRLQLDPQTGSLIIRNLRKTDAGVYFLEIKNRGGTAYRKYKVTLSGEVETVSVKEGGDVTLVFPGNNVYNSKWEFEEERGFIATLIIKDNSKKPNEPDVRSVGRFKDRLQLDPQTGFLTVKKIRPEHTGLYTVKTNPGYNFTKSFNVVFDDFSETSGNESEITGFMGRIQRFCGLARIGGVFGNEEDEMKSQSVKEGDVLNLNTDTEIKTDDEIIVRFGTSFRKSHPYVTIARFSEQDDEFKSGERRFKDRLKMDLTGPLTITITNLETTDCGDYYVQITNKKKKSFKSFTFIVVPWVDAVKSVTVKKGKPIYLDPLITDLHKDDQMLWTFGPHDMIIANTNTSRCDKRFKDRVNLDKTTGSLTIRYSTSADAGMYHLQIISGNRVRNKTFNVTFEEDDASTRVQIADDNEPDEDESSAFFYDDLVAS